MKTFLLLPVILLFVGCSGLPKTDLTSKSIMLKGFNSVNIIDTGYNPTTGTFTPKMTSVFSNGAYSSVPVSKTSKSYLNYQEDRSSSIFNSEVENSSISLIFSTSDDSVMADVLGTIKASLDGKIEVDTGIKTDTNKE